ncbi:DUF5677 domain-containing protein [Aliivibrio fischeri]|uniref:DUF5677 domain-containing protein n=1 Tax=Aliivibrio fischeri TaxID=668 RepID=UPI003F76E844
MNYLNSFRKQKGFDRKRNLSSIQVALDSAAEAFELARNLNASIINQSEKDALISRTHYILLNRTYQHIEGMLTCIASASYSSAEALGRVVNESSINLLFMLLKGDERTITAYLAKWYKEQRMVVEKWKAHLDGKEHQEKVSKLIDSRMDTLELYKEYTEKLKQVYSVKESELNGLWYNTMHKRFSELDRFEEYVEVYHRLSGASHVTAEDTMASLMSSQLPEEAKVLIEHESNSYSIMMSRVVISSFLDAVTWFAIRNGLEDVDKLERMLELKKIIGRAVDEIASDAGVPAANEEEKIARFEALKSRLGVSF